MPGSVNLSVILTTHAEREHFESLLLTLTRINRPGIELIVINDSSDPVIAETVQKELANCQNDQVYYFEHDKKTGRGNCLNEGLVQATGMFLWAPLKARSLNETLLVDSIRRFRSDPAAFWSLDFSLPKEPLSWIEAAKEGELPDDSCLVWNRHVINSNQFFFNPFLNQFHGAELALRLSRDNVWHKTDPFFVLTEDQSPICDAHDAKELYYTLLRLNPSEENKNHIFQQLNQSPSENNHKSTEDDQLLQARQYLNQGDANRSLEVITRFLKKNPGHHEASRIKVTSLEKLRRHVEAAELKHQLQKMDSMPKEQAELFIGEESVEKNAVSPDAIELSIIIPTTGAGKALLESALTYLEDAVDKNYTELIVIDNASIDDTFEYLEQLKKSNYLNLRVITNKSNKGFGASVNQGVEAASGNYILIMHNDVYLENDTIELLTEAFSKNENLAISAPVLNESDITGQAYIEGETTEYIQLEYADSCCFMIPKNLPVKFDEEYHLCHFEMDDFCRQIAAEGYKITAVTRALIRHEQAKTTEMMGFKLVPKLKWINRDRFYKKWSEPSQYVIPTQGTHPDRFIKLGVPDNPLNPDLEWIDAIQNYLTNEVRTEILKTDWNAEDLICIVTSLLIADERELLRTLEDRLDSLELPSALLILFVEYYFNKNIYSRCRHYLEKAGKSHPSFDLYRLKIFVADKETERAAPLLTKMLDKYPASPDLLHVAGNMYRNSGDDKEAQSFYALASQLDPFRFSVDEVGFEINP